MSAAADPPLRHGSIGSRTRPRQRARLSLWAAAWAAAACGAGLTLSGLVGLADLGEATALLCLGVGCGALGTLGVRRLRPPHDPPATATFVAAGSALLTMIAISVAAYLATGTTGSVPDAIFESVAGFCTTNLTVLEGLESLPAGVLFWRALTQWIGGFAALALLVAALPLHVPALVLPGDGGVLPDRASAPPFGTQVRRLAIVYCTVGVLCAAAYAAAGMGAFDAVGYAFTTTSTGGFGNHDGGLAHFDSVAVDAVASVFMALAGVSAVTLWWAVRGRFRILRRSFELRVYLLVLAAAILVVTAWTWDSRGPEALRSGALAVTAAMSSTGFEAAWSDWAWGAQMLIVALIATGGMDGTAGGGFRMRRAIAVARYAYRELVTEIHPHTVHVVKIGRRSVGERPLAMLNGFQILFALSVVAGVFALSLAGMDLWAGAGASVSALATMGPAPGVDPATLGAPERGILAVLMLLGRLAFFPLLVAAGWALAGTRRLLPADRPNGRRGSP